MKIVKTLVAFILVIGCITALCACTDTSKDVNQNFSSSVDESTTVTTACHTSAEPTTIITTGENKPSTEPTTEESTTTTTTAPSPTTTTTQKPTTTTTQKPTTTTTKKPTTAETTQKPTTTTTTTKKPTTVSTTQKPTTPITDNILVGDGDTTPEKGKVIVRAQNVSWGKNGSLVAYCYVINGLDIPAGHFKLKNLSFYNSKGLIASGNFGYLKEYWLEPDDCLAWTFSFNPEHVYQYGVDLLDPTVYYYFDIEYEY